MTTTASTRTGVWQVGRSRVRSIRTLAGAAGLAIVVSGLAVFWTDTETDVYQAEQPAETAAMTAGLSDELPAVELMAIRDAEAADTDSSGLVDSGLSREALNAELSAIWRETGAVGESAELGLSQELLAEELAAIHAE